MDTKNIIVTKDMLPVRDIRDIKNRSDRDELFFKSVAETHTKEELDSLHRAIRYTKMFKQEESLAKMDEESPIERFLQLPKDLKNT